MDLNGGRKDTYWNPPFHPMVIERRWGVYQIPSLQLISIRGNLEYAKSSHHISCLLHEVRHILDFHITSHVY
jgi:hypothetical protein